MAVLAGTQRFHKIIETNNSLSVKNENENGGYVIKASTIIKIKKLNTGNIRVALRLLR